MGQTFAYLRVSTNDQDLEKNKADILSFANDRNFGKVAFVEEKASGKKSWKDRKIKAIIDNLGDGDRLLVPELSRLGRSMLEVMEILAQAKEKGISVYAIKGNWELNGSIQSKIVGMVFAMAAEIERDLISARTKEALKARKAAGVKLGRPKGKGKSKLDPYTEEIDALLKMGVPQIRVAKKYGVHVLTLRNWLEKRKAEVEKTENKLSTTS